MKISTTLKTTYIVSIFMRIHNIEIKQHKISANQYSFIFVGIIVHNYHEDQLHPERGLGGDI